MTNDDNKITNLAVSMHHQKGVYAVLLGAGASRGAQMPTAWDIVRNLIREKMTAEGIPLPETNDGLDAWFEETYGVQPDYSTLITEIAPSPPEQRILLDSYFVATPEDRAAGRKVPSAAHHALAQLAKAKHIRVIMTLNFDNLIEQALDDANVEYNVISSAAEIQGAQSYTHSNGVQVLKIHGDYRRDNVRNSTSDLDTYPDEMKSHLNRLLDDFGLIVCGWSARYDHALTELVMSLPSRRYSTIWVEPETPNKDATRVIDQRKAVVVQGTADEFFPKLQRRVQTLDESTYTAPLTLELIQGEVRQALRDPHGGRQRLIDLLDDLGNRLNDTLTSDDLPWLINNYDVNEHAVRKAEAATTPLLHAIGTLTRFDPDGQYASVLTDALERIDFGITRPNEDSPSGSALHAIPAALVISGAALVAVANKQFHYLSAVFATTMYPTSSHQHVRTLVQVSLNVQQGSTLISPHSPFDRTNRVRDMAKTSTEPFLNPRTLHLDLDISQMLVGLAVEAALTSQPDAGKTWWIGEYILDNVLVTPAAGTRFRNVAPPGQLHLSSLFKQSAQSATQVAIRLLDRITTHKLTDVSSEHIIRQLEYNGGW